MTSTAILIPARIGSKRFPGKPLIHLDGVPMIRRIYDICSSTGLQVYVLTDSEEICKVIPNGDALMTDGYSDLPPRNGTERCSIAAAHIKDLAEHDYFINVQGDMPDITPEMIHKVRALLDHYTVSTLYTDLPENMKEDPNTVKMITNGDIAHWFGRGFKYGHHHLGIYGYRKTALKSYYHRAPSEYEIIEELEQLRWFEGGLRIGVDMVQFNGIEINTPEDAERWNAND